MRKAQKNQLDNLLVLLDQAHTSVKDMIKAGDLQTAAAILESCQNSAISIGQTIEEEFGEGTVTVGHLEEYCELLFVIHEELLSGEKVSADSVSQRLARCYLEVIQAYNSDVQVKKEAVFLPYKASMWDSLESVWKKYAADPEWETFVVPIPYFDKKNDGTLGEYHYEGEEYPADVPIVYYKDYDIKASHPEAVFIHNPYDGHNFVTTVHPAYYAKVLCEQTDKLVYIPYFVLGEPDPNSKESIENVAHFAQTPGVIYADEVIVQSENMKKCYVEAMVEQFGEETRAVWENKIKGTGSPKLEKVAALSKENIAIPDEWRKKIYREDGSAKKVILYNTSVGAFIKDSEKMINKIEDALAFFKERKDDITLLWRPHPLMKATIASMRPALVEAYDKIVEKYIAEDYGIYDDSADLDRAIALSDAYYGDPSSVVQLCQSVKMPIMIQNIDIMNCE